jgi:glucokinase
MGIIGVDLGGTKVKVGVVQNNRLIKVVSRDIDNKDSMLGVVKQITDVVDKVFDENIKAIGIGVPSIIDLKKGIVFEVTNIPSWRKVPLKKLLEKKYKVPVLVNNDAKCFVLGEKYFGQGKKFKNLVGITVGTGIGGGIIINNKLYTGENCGAGEFCNILYKNANLETYSSGMFYKKLKVSGKELHKRAEKADKKAIRILKEQGYHIGKLLAAVVNSIDPEIIILYGSITNDYKFWKKAMLESLKESVYKRAYSRLKIAISKNKDIAVMGAASLYADSLR